MLFEPISKYVFSPVAFHPKRPALATLDEGDTVIRIWDLDIDVLLGSGPAVESVRYTTAKIALVGDSGVGKTGLGWRLAHGEFKDHPSTHGEQFWILDRLDLPRPSHTECEVVLWDFAGQPDYRLIHALFLDNADVALVLFDPNNRQEPLKGVEYWLKALSRRKGQPCRTLLVGARTDRGALTLTPDEIDHFCQSNKITGGYLGTSALTGENVEQLMGRISSSIVWDEITTTVTTATFKRIKQYVLELKEDKNQESVLLGMRELRDRLRSSFPDFQFTDRETTTAIGHLAKHGYVTVLRRTSGDEMILLTPSLVNNLAASFVLEARRNPKGLGALEERQVLGGGYRFPELAGLYSGEKEILLDAATVLFLEHNICFRETLGNEIFLVFPALINQKKPLTDDIPVVDDCSYTITGAVENVYAALVVLLGYTNTFTRTNQWHNQAQYEMREREVCGFRQVAEREGEIELILYYGLKVSQHTRFLFQGLFEKFLAERDVKIMRYPQVECLSCSYRQERSAVMKRVKEEMSFLFCTNCGARIGIPKLGEEIILTGKDREQVYQQQDMAKRRTAFEAVLTGVKALVRDRGEDSPTPSCFVSYAWGTRKVERWVAALVKDLQKAGIDLILDQQSNAAIGSNVARFIARITESDFIVVVGTPLYRKKYENRITGGGSVTAAEMDLIHNRLIGTEDEKNTILPLLYSEDPKTSFPPLLRGKVYADFRREEDYFKSLFDLILTLLRIPFDSPAVGGLRESIREYHESTSLAT
ncbi:MAG: TIR domain-containing protein [Acidobacteriota bacterium]